MGRLTPYLLVFEDIVPQGICRQLGHRPIEGAKIVHHPLIDQHIAVGKEKGALLTSRLSQPPDDLKRGVHLAWAGGP